MTEIVRVADATARQMADVAGGRTLLVPVGSTEQHGPHLPLGTDTIIAEAVARGVVGRLGDAVVIGPTIGYGASGEHAGFVGTLSIGTEALAMVLIELGRSADAFGALVFVNGHGGNTSALDAATRVLADEGRWARAWSWRIAGADAHAGRTETSLLLAIEPSLVRSDLAEPGRVEPLTELLDELRADGVAAVSTNGVLGDPTGASAAEGRAMLETLVDDLAALLSASSGVG